MNVTRTYKRESIPAAIDKGILKVARKYCEESFSDFNQLIDNALAVYLQLSTPPLDIARAGVLC